MAATRSSWGKPLAALLGAYEAQRQLGMPAIGGKDSMSGSFNDLSVPPTLVAFAVTPMDVHRVISPEFKQAGNAVVLLPLARNEVEIPDFSALHRIYDLVEQRIGEGRILAACSVKAGGLVEALSKMAFGNRLGLAFCEAVPETLLFSPDYGSLVLEVAAGEDLSLFFAGISYRLLGRTQERPVIDVNGCSIDLDEALAKWQAPLESVFPTQTADEINITNSVIYKQPQFEQRPAPCRRSMATRPRVLLAVFPGSNCEYDTARAFERAGALVDTLAFRNLTAEAIEESVKEMAARLAHSQILMLPGGFSAGDEPEGSAKFITAVLRQPRIRRALERFLKKQDGLILGICNGFQALIKTGLLPGGEFREPDALSPTLAVNTIGRHVARMVRTRVVSVLSPWFSRCRAGEIHTVPVSHGEGRFVAPAELIAELFERGQVATQYVDLEGQPSVDIRFNPNGSLAAIEAITSADGRILGKMAHSERIAPYTFVNIPGDKDQKIFQSGVDYFS